MRIVAFLCFSLVLYFDALAQPKPSSLSLYASLVNDAEVLHKTTLGDWSRISQTGCFEIGGEYGLQLRRNLSVHAGLQFSRYRFTISYTPYPVNPVAIPDDQYNLSLLGLPVSLQFDFWKYGYLRGGLVVDVQTERTATNRSGDATNAISNQSGIGSVFGLGVQYPAAKRFFVYTGLNNEMHGLILFSSTAYKKHIGDFGLRAGVRFQL